MRLLLDADGIIKLYRAGVLDKVIRAFSCAIAQAVFDEVVTRGKASLHQDAEAIESTLADTVKIVPVEGHHQAVPGLGPGELAILSLLAVEPGAVVISDDRRFLAVLSMRDSPFLTPADILVLLARRGILGSAEALQALDRLRPAIRVAAYWDARQDLAPEGGNSEE